MKTITGRIYNDTQCAMYREYSEDVATLNANLEKEKMFWAKLAILIFKYNILH